MKKIITIVIIILSSFVLSSCGQEEQYDVARMDYFNYLNTISYVYVEYNIENKTKQEINQDLQGVKNVLTDIEKTFSISKTGNMSEPSLLMQINEEAGHNSIEVNADMSYVLTKALMMASLSNGGFEPSIGPLTTLWKISEKTQYCPKEYNCPDDDFEYVCRPPSDEEISEAQKLVDYTKINLNDHHLSMELGMKLDLGSIAKGYAADKVAIYLKQKGYHFALINLGGNSLMFGKSFTNPHIATQIQNPMGQGNVLSMEVYDTSVVTSAINERYYIHDNNYYHHLLDPATGYPFDNSIVSVSIVTKLSVEADGYSTVVFSLGLTKGLDLIKATDGVEAIIITKDYKIHTTIDATLNEEFLGIYSLVKYLN